jgi:hypothetical protein
VGLTPKYTRIYIYMYIYIYISGLSPTSTMPLTHDLLVPPIHSNMVSYTIKEGVIIYLTDHKEKRRAEFHLKN